jgi:hypothetical protein
MYTTVHHRAASLAYNGIGHALVLVDAVEKQLVGG